MDKRNGVHGGRVRGKKQFQADRSGSNIASQRMGYRGNGSVPISNLLPPGIKRKGFHDDSKTPAEIAELLHRDTSTLTRLLVKKTLRKKQGCPLMLKRLLADGTFVCSAFAFYSGLSPCNAYIGRQLQILPDFDGPDLPEPETSGQ